MKRATFVLLVLGLLGAVFGPGLLELRDHFLGLEYVDHYGTQWFYWYTETQLFRGESFGHTDLFFHPWGKDVFGHTGSNVLDGILAIPFRKLFGGVLGYNLFVLFGLGLSAWAFWGLARDHSDDRFACGVATLLFALSPSILHDLSEGRPTQAVLLFPVLFLRMMLRTRRDRRWRWPLLGGLFLALSGYQYWFYALFFGLAALAAGLWATWRPDPQGGGRLRTLARFALMALLAGLLVAPVAVPLVLAASTDGEVPGLLAVEKWSLLATPPVTAEDQTIGLYAWQPLRRWGGFHVLDGNLTEHFLAQGLLLPWLWVPLALFYLVGERRIDRGTFVAMTLTSMVIATGSIVLVGDYALPNPPFIALSKALSFMQRLWWPARAIVVFVVLLGIVLTELLTWLGRFGRPVQVLGAVLLSAAWLGELRSAGHVPFPSWDADIPAGYECLAHGEPGAIIELPHSWTQAHLYYQTFHHRPMMGGMLENNPVFTPDELLKMWESNDWLQELHGVSRLATDEVPYQPEQLQEIRDLGYRYVVLQKDAYGTRATGEGMSDNVLRTRLRQMQRHLGLMVGRPVYEDARVAIYSPWGDPSPCEGVDIVKDPELTGGTEVQAAERVREGQQAQVIRRVWDTDLEVLLELDELSEAGDRSVLGEGSTEEEVPGEDAPGEDAPEEEAPGEQQQAGPTDEEAVP